MNLASVAVGGDAGNWVKSPTYFVDDFLIEKEPFVLHFEIYKR
jgi:hypothetical protein